MVRPCPSLVLAGTLAFTIPSALGAQSSAPQTIFSIGQPPTWRQHVSLQGTAYSSSRATDGTLSWGFFHSFNRPPSNAFNPVLGLIGATLEGYGSAGGEGFHDAGARGFFTSRLFATSIGVDWDIRNARVDPIFSWQGAIRRGGLLGRGTMLRVDWLPKRDHVVRVGLTAPLFQPLAGRVRPRKTTATISASRVQELSSRAQRGICSSAACTPLPPDAQRLARDLREATALIAAYSNVYRDESVRAVGAGAYTTAMERARTSLHQLFRSASLDSARASAAARRARLAVLERVLVPVNSVFGQVKTVDLARLADAARADFERWTRDSSALDSNQRGSALAAFQLWLDAASAALHPLVERERDTRLVWLPLDLALTLDDFDEQVEIDSLIARLVGRPFTDRNALGYLRSTDLPLEIARSIYSARDYHVLWTHEFMGRDWYSRAIDQVGYEMVADAYLPALTAAVKRYDSTGVIPTYLILHDQYFYETADGRLWLTILDDPLHASLRLKGDDGTRERHLAERREELRRAIAGSVRLQRDARATGDAERWLRSVIRVRVNVGNQSDFSFRSSHIIPGIPFTPDNVMRDHRKLVMYDLNEADPTRGALFVMGVGIGETYSNASWEDRGFRVRGPVALEARAALRRTLLRNGFSENDIPAPLRAVASQRAQEQAANSAEFIGRALQVHNEVGFGDKKSSVARATLYNLAQPGSVIIVPDQLWLSDTWAGMLLGAAARGARVHVIAPAQVNAPVPDAPVMALSHDLFTRLLQLRDQLAPTLRASGGEFRIGVYAAKATAYDAAGRLREVREGLARSPWIRELIPFDDRTLAVLERAEREVAAAGASQPTRMAPDATRPPQPHRKTQLLARPGAIAAFAKQPYWDDLLAEAMRVQKQQTEKFADQLNYSAPAVDTAATRRSDEMMHGYEASIPEAERKRMSFYFQEGSHNMNQRSLMSDGEATLIVSGPQAAGLVDLFYMMARTTWIERPSELDKLVPRQSALVHWFAKRLRATL